VTEDMLCVPKLFVSVPKALLRVVDNDTGVELPQIFFKVAPHVYKSNKVYNILRTFIRQVRFLLVRCVFVHCPCSGKQAYSQTLISPSYILIWLNLIVYTKRSSA